MFKDTPEGQTHSQNDSSVEPAHNPSEEQKQGAYLICKSLLECCDQYVGMCHHCIKKTEWVASLLASREAASADHAARVVIKAVEKADHHDTWSARQCVDAARSASLPFLGRENKE